MGKPHSEETRRKISDALKRAHERRRIDASPTAQKVRHLAGKFAEGNPTHEAPNAVRNYGDFGRDLKPTTAVRQNLTPALTMPQQAEVTAQTLGLARTPVVKAKKTGEHMATRDPVPMNTASPRDRATLTKQREAHKMRVAELKRIREGNGDAS